MPVLAGDEAGVTVTVSRVVSPAVREDGVVAPGAVLDVAPGQGTVLFAGTGAARYREPLQEALGTRGRFVEVAGPSAVSVAAYAGERFRKGTFEDLNSVVPAYGRAPDITRPKKSGP